MEGFGGVYAGSIDYTVFGAKESEPRQEKVMPCDGFYPQVKEIKTCATETLFVLARHAKAFFDQEWLWRKMDAPE